MTTVGGPDEGRFPYRNGTRSRSEVAVVVRPDVVRVELPMLARGASIPLRSIGRVVWLDGRVDDPGVYRGDPRALKLAPSAAVANVVLVLHEPVVVSGFKRGSEQALGITKAERRSSIRVDEVAVAVADPDALVARLAERGAVAADSLPDARLAVFGAAPPEEADRVRAARASAQRRSRFLMIGVAVAVVLLFSLRLHIDEPGSTLPGHVAEQALAAFLLVGLVAGAAALLPLQTRPGRSGGPLPSSAPMVAARIGGILALVALTIVLRQVLDVPYVLAYAPVAAAPAGVIIWVVIRQWRYLQARARAEPPPPSDPSIATGPYRRDPEAGVPGGPVS